MSIRILVVEDHKIVRESLRSILEKEPDFEVVAEAENGSEAIARAAEFQVDLVLMDLTLPDMNGMEATRRIVAELPEVRVIALTMHSDKRFITESLKAGAKGYLVKGSETSELLEAIRTVANGDPYLSRSLRGGAVTNDFNAFPEESSSGTSPLTQREREVLQKIIEGESTKEIAFNFGVCTNTIGNQRRLILKKLKLRNIAELTRYAIREGLASL